jgi:GT2 family glycosyltransferase
VLVDLVVVNYRTPDDLARFIASAKEHCGDLDASLTVVDVESDEDSGMFLWGSGNLGRRVAVTDNIGYGRACNLGASLGDAEVVALFNADVELSANSVQLCVSQLLGHDQWGVLGPRQIDDAGRIRHAGIFGTLTRPVHRGWNEVDRHQYTDTRRAVTVAGSAYFVKRAVWDELTACYLFREIAPDALGAFLPTPHYYEETWASYHALAHGFDVIYFGGVTVRHRWHGASPLGGWAERQMPISQQLFREACDHHAIPHD